MSRTKDLHWTRHGGRDLSDNETGLFFTSNTRWGSEVDGIWLGCLIHGCGGRSFDPPVSSLQRLDLWARRSFPASVLNSYPTQETPWMTHVLGGPQSPSGPSGLRDSSPLVIPSNTESPSVFTKPGVLRPLSMDLLRSGLDLGCPNSIVDYSRSSKTPPGTDSLNVVEENPSSDNSRVNCLFQ